MTHEELIKSCKHKRLHIGSGGYYIICSECSAFWVAIKSGGKDVDLDYSRQFGNIEGAATSWEEVKKEKQV